MISLTSKGATQNLSHSPLLHDGREENESRASTKFVQLHRNETTSGEAIVSIIQDCEKPLNLGKKRKFESNDLSYLNCEPFTGNNISNSVTRLDTGKSQHKVNHLSTNKVHFESLLLNHPPNIEKWSILLNHVPQCST